MTAHTAAATSPPWRVSTQCTSPSLVCPSLEAPTRLLLAKVGQSWQPCPSPLLGPPMGGSAGGSHSSPLPPCTLGLCASTVWVSSVSPPLGPFFLLLSPSPSLSLSSRFHLRKNLLQLSRNPLLSTLPTGSTVLESALLWERRAGKGWETVWSSWEEAHHILVWATGPGVMVPFSLFLACPSLSPGAKF